MSARRKVSAVELACLLQYQRDYVRVRDRLEELSSKRSNTESPHWPLEETDAYKAIRREYSALSDERSALRKKIAAIVAFPYPTPEAVALRGFTLSLAEAEKFRADLANLGIEVES